MRFHWQNLNERKDGSTGLGLRYGRAWWWFGEEIRGAVLSLCWHWNLLEQIGVRFESGGTYDEHDFSVAIHLPFLSLYLHTDRVFPRRWRREGDGRVYGLVMHREDLRLSWDWMANPMSWSKGDAWWMSGSKSLIDVALGRPVYREGDPETHRILVRMPEGSYTGTCVMRSDSWKRPLWFRKTIRRAHIDMDEGQQVPVPGKGENSWDCGEDGIYGMTCPARSPREAVNHVRESAFRSREKYGGKNWTPSNAR